MTLLRSSLFPYLVVAACCMGDEVIADDTAPQKRALLIGVGQYPLLPDSLQLRGPINDVRLLEDVLSSRLGFAANQIVTLTDDSAADRLPTRENILREFRGLANDLRGGDEVFIYFSGHGTQQPDRADPGADAAAADDYEPDGLDEVLCARDVAKITVQDGVEIPGGVVDDEIAVLLKNLLATGANVWMVLDCCHSGTATRGDETIRGIPPRELVPERALSTVRGKSRGGEVRRESINVAPAKTRGSAPTENSGNLVVLYAAQSNEPTVEKRLPRTGAERKPHGLLTFSLAQLLSSRPAGLSYQKLSDELAQIYLGDGRTSPTPWMEGAELRRAVFGGAEHSVADRSRLTVDRRGRTVATVGTFDGVGPGTIFVVLDDQSHVVAHARVVAATAFESVLEACTIENDAPEKPLPKSGSLRIVKDAAPAIQLKLHVASDFTAAPSAAPSDYAWPPGIDASASVTDADLALSRDGNDWILKSTADDVVVKKWPSAGFATQQLDELDSLLLARLRVKRLLEVTASLGASPAETGIAALRLSTKVIAYDDVRDRVGKPLSNAPELKDGRIVAFEIVNESATPIDLTLLLVDAAGRLQPVFPQPGREGDARLPAGKTLRTPRAVVEAAAVGIEHLLVIAAAADGAPRTFAWVADTPAPADDEAKVRTRGASASALHEALLGRTSLRGAGGELVIQRISWRVTP